MNIFFLFALCFLPVITFFTLFSFIPKEKQILKYLISCIFGIFTILPASFIQFFALKLHFFNSDSFLSILLTAIIFNGLIEELSKLGFLIISPKKNHSLQTFFLASLLLGISAGSMETIIYVLGNVERTVITEGTNGTIKLILMRMFTSQILHAICAGLSGIFVWGARYELKHLIVFIYAILFHGFYNFFIAFDSYLKFFAIVPILLGALECRIWYKTVRNSEILPKNELTQSEENSIL